MQNLKILRLNLDSLENLPSKINQLKSLKELYVEGTELMSLPPEIGQLQNLSKLSLDRNSLSNLPENIKMIKSLKNIYLHGNPFTEAKIIELREAMPWCEIFWIPRTGEGLFQMKKFQEAFQTKQNDVAADSTNSNLQYDLSWYALFAQQPKAAIKAARKVLELTPEKTRC